MLDIAEVAQFVIAFDSNTAYNIPSAAKNPTTISDKATAIKKRSGTAFTVWASLWVASTSRLCNVEEHRTPVERQGIMELLRFDMIGGP